MLNEQQRDEWRVRQRAVPIYPSMMFTAEGLVLGARTVLLAADGALAVENMRGREARVLALLSAAYDKAVMPAVLGNIARAAKAWREGDGCLAHIHLAHTGLKPLHDLRADAYRLFLAENALKAGASARAVFAALHLDARYVDAVEKLYNPDQPRVPAGSGRTSGQWTDSEEDGEGAPATAQTAGAGTKAPSLLSRMPAPSPSFLGELGASQVAELGAYAARLATPIGAAVAAFGLLFIPSPNNIRVEGEVPEIPGLRYSWNRDETLLHLTYDDPDGAHRTFALHLDDDIIRDDRGQVVGRVIGGNRIAIDAIAISSDLVKQAEPRLCPAPAPDVPGSDQGKPYEENRSRQYEDFVKSLINPPPGGPTPSGFVYYMPNPENGKPVSYDDCKKANGILFEIKGEGITKLTNGLPDLIAEQFKDQARRQLAASGGRPIVWIFAEKEAALFTRKLFDKTNGLEGITVGYIPWTKE